LLTAYSTPSKRKKLRQAVVHDSIASGKAASELGAAGAITYYGRTGSRLKLRVNFCRGARCPAPGLRSRLCPVLNGI
jgi:hypothetical protein